MKLTIVCWCLSLNEAYHSVLMPSIMLIPEIAALGVCCSYYWYNDVNSDQALTFTFVTHNGHFFLKIKLDCFPQYQGPTSTKELYHHNTHSVKVGSWYEGAEGIWNLKIAIAIEHCGVVNLLSICFRFISKIKKAIYNEMMYIKDILWFSSKLVIKNL